MRLNIRHETTYTYETPASRAMEVLRLTPRGHDGQFIINWRIDVDRDCHLDQSTDAFGNIMHSFSAEGPLDSLSIVAEGRVETADQNGVLTGQIERFPPVVFLRTTPLTTSDAALRTFADQTVRGAASRLDAMHTLMHALHERLTCDVDAASTGTNAAEAFGQGHGVYQDFAHVFVAAARHVGVPARYAGGYLLRKGAKGGQSGGHAWAEALIEGLGWVGFDAVNDVCPTDAYVRVAAGLDYLGAAPIRGVTQGGSGEHLSVRVTVTPDSRGAA